MQLDKQFAKKTMNDSLTRDASAVNVAIWPIPPQMTIASSVLYEPWWGQQDNARPNAAPPCSPSWTATAKPSSWLGPPSPRPAAT
jgi:hypothetical protein